MKHRPFTIPNHILLAALAEADAQTKAENTARRSARLKAEAKHPTPLRYARIASARPGG